MRIASTIKDNPFSISTVYNEMASRTITFLTTLIVLSTSGFVAQAQTIGQYPSNCDVNDSVRRGAEGYANLFLRNYLIDANLPEKDSLVMDSTMLKKVTDAVIAVYQCDSLPHYDSIADGFFFERIIKTGYYSEFLVGEYKVDPSSQFGTNLCNDGKYSGDPSYDSLAARYNLRTDGCWVMYGKGPYNLLPLRDSIASIPWFTYIGDQINPIGGGPEPFRMKVVNDTVYLMFGVLTWDCPAKCHYALVANYAVYPDCSVDYKGGSAQFIDVPVEDDLIQVNQYYCGDSVTLTLTGNWKTVEWSNGSDSMSEVFKESGDYWIKAYPADTNALIKIERFFLELIKPQRYRGTLTDTSICYGDSIQVRLPDTSLSAFIYNETKGSVAQPIPAVISDTGTYRLFKPNCFNYMFHVGQVLPGRILGPDTVFICKEDSITLMADPSSDHYRWSNNDTLSSTVAIEPGWATCCFTKNSCTSCDSVLVKNLTQPDDILPGDTTISYEDTLVLTLDSGFQSVVWFNGDTTFQVLIDTTVLGPGSHWVKVSINDSNGCRYSDSLRLTRKMFVGLIRDLVIITEPYPNPFSTSISLDKNLHAEHYSVYDQTGRLIRSGELDFSQNLLNLSDLPPGQYLLKVSSSNTNHIYRIIRATH